MIDQKTLQFYGDWHQQHTWHCIVLLYGFFNALHFSCLNNKYIQINTYGIFHDFCDWYIIYLQYVNTLYFLRSPTIHHPHTCHRDILIINFWKIKKQTLRKILTLHYWGHEISIMSFVLNLKNPSIINKLLTSHRFDTGGVNRICFPVSSFKNISKIEQQY